MNFAEKLRTKESYIEQIQAKSQSFVNSTTITINSFESFLDEKHKISSEYMLKELLNMDEERRIDSTCDILQSWVNYMHNNKKKSPKTIKDYFSFLKMYLHYRKIKLTPEDIRESITLPTQISEEKYPLQTQKILDILEAASYAKKGLYLSLLSSGMRIGEAVQIRKKEVFTNLDRTMIKIPAKITKTKKGRTTYISREATKFIRSKLKSIDDNDLVWGTNEDPILALGAEEKAFREYLKKIGFTEKYDSGRLKITLHSFRAYFFTKATRCHDENYAHKMTGHGGYLMQYDRLTDEEKLEMYVELEPDLLVYDQTKNEEKIRKLKEANSKIIEQQESIEQFKREHQQKMEIMQAQMDRLLHAAQNSGLIKQIKIPN